ncbi:melatonin receptor type 1B-B [Trichomycterus rosablanca]|uniref:melatonin receptor type 1B-B n=1 Tax=Trichomycterus rosablanca TaxID=2290929 RepID=UPI002F356B17
MSENNRTEAGQGNARRALDSGTRPAWAIALLASVLIFTTVVDVLGNSLVIISVLRNRKLRNAGNVFVVSLAFADLVVAFYPYPLVLYALFHDGWSLGDTQCKVSGFLMGLSVIGSVFNITAIALNRYCYICHSFAYERLYSFRNTLLLVALIWMLTVLAILPNFFVGSLSYDARVYSCTFTQTASSSYTVVVVVVHFLVPIAVVTFCYLRIWVLVIRVRRKAKKEERVRVRPSDLRNFVTMFIVFVLFAICWAPLNFIGLVVAVNPEVMAPRIPEWLFVVSYFMAYFNSCLNAIIYGLLNRNFRSEYKRIVTSVWLPRLFVSETSRAATDGVRSKPSPARVNNMLVKISAHLQEGPGFIINNNIPSASTASISNTGLSFAATLNCS